MTKGVVYLKNTDGSTSEKLDVPMTKEIETMAYTFLGLMVTAKKERPEMESIVIDFGTMTWEFKEK